MSAEVKSGAEDLPARMRRAAAAVHQPAAGAAAAASGPAVTSDLSIDEVLLLHGAGWEPVELVCGVAVCSVPAGAWVWGQGEIAAASDAHNKAVATAAARILHECARAGGSGVVGVHVDVSVQPHHVDVELVGTAVRPLPGVDQTWAAGHQPFMSDLSARDFVLLRQAGWVPVTLVFGASFVYAPRRSVGAAISQKTQNVELTNMTEAVYAARESAMERMQSAALRAKAGGGGAVSITEGEVRFARHAVGFTTWGTAVRVEPDGHRRISPRVVLPLDDAEVLFEARSLRDR